MSPLLGFQAERLRRTFWCTEGKAQFIDMHSMTLGFTCNSFSDSCYSSCLFSLFADCFEGVPCIDLRTIDPQIKSGRALKRLRIRRKVGSEVRECVPGHLARGQCWLFTAGCFPILVSSQHLLTSGFLLLQQRLAHFTQCHTLHR